MDKLKIIKLFQTDLSTNYSNNDLQLMANFEKLSGANANANANPSDLAWIIAINHALKTGKMGGFEPINRQYPVRSNVGSFLDINDILNLAATSREMRQKILNNLNDYIGDRIIYINDSVDPDKEIVKIILNNLTSVEIIYIEKYSQITKILKHLNPNKLTKLIMEYVNPQIVTNREISRFINLRILDVGGVDDSFMDQLEELKELRELYITASFVGVFPILKIPHLKVLSIIPAEDRADELNITNLSQINTLQSLRLDENVITDLSSLLDLKELKYLSLNNCQIDNIIPLVNLKKLEFLDLGNNLIKDIEPLSELINLRELYLEKNQIINIKPLSKLINLKILYLSYNQIKNIQALSELINLNELLLRNNQITNLNPLSELINLKILDLRHNQIIDVSPLRNLINLEELHLGYNRIIDVSPLSTLTNLVSLSLPSNQITSVNSLADLKLISLLVDEDVNTENISDQTAITRQGY